MSAIGPRTMASAFIEAFNSKLRTECLNTHWFMNLEDACEKMEAWRRYTLLHGLQISARTCPLLFSR